MLVVGDWSAKLNVSIFFVALVVSVAVCPTVHAVIVMARVSGMLRGSVQVRLAPVPDSVAVKANELPHVPSVWSQRPAWVSLTCTFTDLTPCGDVAVPLMLKSD